MRLLLIGGAGFMGTHVLGALVEAGHDVTVFHRHAKSAIVAGVRQIEGDRNGVARYRYEFRRLAPDVVIDFILSYGGQAQELMSVFRGMAARVVALSSGDVYRAAGISHGSESGPLQSMPLTEDSALRTNLHVYGPETLARLRSVFSWLGEDYDKIPVEQAILGDSKLPGTVLRLPMVYGPGDPLHRLFPYLKRMADGRPFILLEDVAAEWRGPRGYVSNVASAIVEAATLPAAAGRIYNVAEEPAFAERDWVERIGRAVGWRGRVQALPPQLMPEHLKQPGNHQQHWVMSSARIRGELAYREPVDLEVALRQTIAWEQAHPPVFDPAQFDYAAEDAAAKRIPTE